MLKAMHRLPVKVSIVNREQVVEEERYSKSRVVGQNSQQSP